MKIKWRLYVQWSSTVAPYKVAEGLRHKELDLTIAWLNLARFSSDKYLELYIQITDSKKS